jgi:hypothetical protein
VLARRTHLAPDPHRPRAGRLTDAEIKHAAGLVVAGDYDPADGIAGGRITLPLNRITRRAKVP